VHYDDEAVFFTNDDDLTNSFRRRFDDRWVDTTEVQDFANITGPPVRHYPLYPIHRSMNFPPLEDFPLRVISRLDREPQSIDAIVFRITDSRLSDAVTRAVARGVPVRLITEPSEYRNPCGYGCPRRSIGCGWGGADQDTAASGPHARGCRRHAWPGRGDLRIVELVAAGIGRVFRRA
jgi:phosphatidylserine/phosphatidylglycerophosphate/cardiolipin synthase-like enzyme